MMGIAAPPGPPAVTFDEALRVARTDAERVYRHLHRYRAEVRLEADGWHVDFDHADPDVQSGGPHYIIAADTAAILHKRYEQ